MDKENSLFAFNKNEFPIGLAIAAMVIVVISWMVLGMQLAFEISKLPFADWNLTGVGDYLIVHVPYLLMFISLWATSNYLLKTDLRTMISGSGRKYRYRMSLRYGGIYLLYLMFLSLLSAGTIDIDPTPFPEKLKYVLPVLLLTPMQAIAEEVFFRALPLRMLFKSKLPTKLFDSVSLSIMSGLLFTIPHLGNPEVIQSSEGISAIAYYFIWGTLAMALGIYCGGFEIPVAIHIVNNLYTALVVNYEGGAMPTHALFINRKATPSNWITILEALVIFAILFGVARKSMKGENNG